MRIKMSALSKEVDSVEPLSEPEFGDIRNRKVAATGVHKEHLASLRPIKAQLSRATAARDRAVIVVGKLRKDMGVLRELVLLRTS